MSTRTIDTGTDFGLKATLGVVVPEWRGRDHRRDADAPPRGYIDLRVCVDALRTYSPA